MTRQRLWPRDRTTQEQIDSDIKYLLSLGFGDGELPSSSHGNGNSVGPKFSLDIAVRQATEEELLYRDVFS